MSRIDFDGAKNTFTRHSLSKMCLSGRFLDILTKTTHDNITTTLEKHMKIFKLSTIIFLFVVFFFVSNASAGTCLETFRDRPFVGINIKHSHSTGIREITCVYSLFQYKITDSICAAPISGPWFVQIDKDWTVWVCARVPAKECKFYE